MHVKLLDRKDLKAIDDLKRSYGGSKEILKTLRERGQYATRKKLLARTEFGGLLDEAEGFAAKFATAGAGRKAGKRALATTQVSGFQDARIVHDCMRRMAADGKTLAPREMISVTALTDYFVYSGDMTAMLAMCENLMGGKFCAASLVGTPLPAKRFSRLQKVTGAKIDTLDAGGGTRRVPMINQGTAFGNLCGVEVANDYHLVYLDSITRTGMETGLNFFLNPSWSTIAAACYFARDMKDFQFKISMLLSTQNTVMLRMLMNIFKEYLRDDGSTPVYEINIGNAVNPDKFCECRNILDDAGFSAVSTAAHIRINPDLGVVDFNWYKNALKVLKCGCNMTIKYESDGQSRPYDTMMAYFISEQERKDKAGLIGDVLYHKCVQCDADAKAIMKLGYPVRFATVSER
jgi:hypothetical protein